MLVTNYQITWYHNQEKANILFLALRSSKVSSSQSSRTAVTASESDCFICGVKSDVAHTAVYFDV